MIREKRSVIQTLVTAMAGKPFLLLAGVSGSGKTQVARRLANGLAMGVRDGNLFRGRPFGALGTARAYMATLQENGIVPRLCENDGDEILDIFSPEEILDPEDYRHSLCERALRDRVAFMPVRPDWTEPQKVWGHYNPLTGLFYPTEAARVVAHAFLEYVAYGDEAPRHFLILDELNLARVEYYLSDILSLMECPTQVIGDHVRLGEHATIHPFDRPLWTQSAPKYETGKAKSVHEQLFEGHFDHGWALAYYFLSSGASGMLFNRMQIDFEEIIYGADWHRVTPPQLTFTPNLTIVGTVNVDETTFSFAPKVLDRAFVMEFNDMHFDEVCASWPGYADARETLRIIYGILRKQNLHFGYRTVREMLNYTEQSRNTWSECGDFLILSKILPKLRGGEDKLSGIVPPLLAFFACGETNFDKLFDVADVLRDAAEGGAGEKAALEAAGLSHARYPLSFRKLFRMAVQLNDNGVTSYF